MFKECEPWCVASWQPSKCCCCVRIGGMDSKVTKKLFHGRRLISLSNLHKCSYLEEVVSEDACRAKLEF